MQTNYFQRIQGWGRAGCLVLACGWAMMGGVQTQADAPASTPPQSQAVREVVTLQETWTDASREGRQVPVTIRYPRQDQASQAACPLIVFSHGLGGTRDGYSFAAEHWASKGYVVVNPQHVGSDDGVFRQSPRPLEAMKQAVKDPQNIINRPRDIRFVIDQVLQANADPKSPLYQRVDADRIGVSGHSFGAYTTLAVGGQRVAGSDASLAFSFKDDRVKAILPMSAPADAERARVHQAFADIALPCLHMTGTNDDSPIGQTDPKERRIPFDQMHLADNYLLTLKDADHAVFSGYRPRIRVKSRNLERDVRHHALILTLSTAFWDAYLKGDKASLQWLQSEQGCQAYLGDEGTFEIKRPVKSVAP